MIYRIETGNILIFDVLPQNNRWWKRSRIRLFKAIKYRTLTGVWGDTPVYMFAFKY